MPLWTCKCRFQQELAVSEVLELTSIPGFKTLIAIMKVRQLPSISLIAKVNFLVVMRGPMEFVWLPASSFHGSGVLLTSHSWLCTVNHIESARICSPKQHIRRRISTFQYSERLATL